MSFLPKAQSHSGYGIAGIVPGSFVTAGAGVNPTVFDGCIVSVEQLDEGAVSFHRVTLDAEFLAGTHVVMAQAELLTETEDLTTTTGTLVADGPGGGPFPAKGNNQVDVLVKDAGTATVAAGRRVNFLLIAKRAGAR